MFESEQPLISIIVPVYDVEPYVARCIESIMSQTHKNLQILLINDGSTDKSGVICDDYAKKDSRITVNHQENAGVSSARNTGLDAAKGDWIGFVDSDDWIQPDMYEKLLEEAQKSDKDIAICGFSIQSDDGKRQTNEIYPEFAKPITRMEALEFIVRQRYLKGSICNMLFCQKLFDDMTRFDAEVHGGEDRVFSVKVFLKSNGSTYLPEPLYHVSQRPNSATATFNERRLTLLLGYERILELVSPVCSKLARKTKFNYMDVSVYLINRAVRNNQLQHLPMLRKAARRYAMIYFFAYDIALAKKLRNASVLFFPRLTNKIWGVLLKHHNMKNLIARLNKR